MEFSYYPGCSLESTAIEYNESVMAVLNTLNISLVELEDWNCCGASSAHSLNRNLSLALPARNLAIAQKSGRDVVMPCAACFNRHKTTDHEMRTDPEKRQLLEKTVGFTYTGTIQIRPLLDIVANEIGLETIRKQVTTPLYGLKAVGYYGCLLVRPASVTQFENPDNPILMNQILDSIGVEARPWSYATECCGGGLSLTRSNVAARLVNRLVERAEEAGAEAIVTSCPLCQVNLEMRQNGHGNKMPIFYFTELIGLSFGLPQAKSWFKKHLINPEPLLQNIALT
jgi:heterodisulfide reductase subunit B